MNTQSRQRGSSLLEGLIAIAILSVGILGLARFQLGMLSQTTDSQSRLVAVSLVDELLTQMRVDPANVNCYTLPQTGGCASAQAREQAQAWQERVEAEVPGFVGVTAERDGPFQFVVEMQWRSKAFTDTRSLEVRTDVRP